MCCYSGSHEFQEVNFADLAIAQEDIIELGRLVEGNYNLAIRELNDFTDNTLIDTVFVLFFQSIHSRSLLQFPHTAVFPLMSHICQVNNLLTQPPLQALCLHSCNSLHMGIERSCVTVPSSLLDWIDDELRTPSSYAASSYVHSLCSPRTKHPPLRDVR
jgi:hypothetical protein